MMENEQCAFLFRLKPVGLYTQISGTSAGADTIVAIQPSAQVDIVERMAEIGGRHLALQMCRRSRLTLCFFISTETKAKNIQVG